MLESKYKLPIKLQSSMVIGKLRVFVNIKQKVAI